MYASAHEGCKMTGGMVGSKTGDNTSPLVGMKSFAVCDEKGAVIHSVNREALDDVFEPLISVRVTIIFNNNKDDRIYRPLCEL